MKVFYIALLATFFSAAVVAAIHLCGTAAEMHTIGHTWAHHWFAAGVLLAVVAAFAVWQGLPNREACPSH